MKRHRIIFWTTTGLFSLMMLFSGYQYMVSPEVEAGFRHLGFPGYFRIELGLAKILGAVALVVPLIPAGFRQFAYAGFTINLLSAFIAHAVSGDPAPNTMMPLVFLVLLIISYIYSRRLQSVQK